MGIILGALLLNHDLAALFGSGETHAASIVAKVMLTAELAVLIAILGGWEGLRAGWMKWALALCFLLGALSSPGIVLAVCLLLLGYSMDDRITIALGVVFLPINIVIFYWSLDIDLAYMSWVLLTSGAALLVLRSIGRRRPWAQNLGAQNLGAQNLGAQNLDVQELDTRGASK